MRVVIYDRFSWDADGRTIGDRSDHARTGVCPSTMAGKWWQNSLRRGDLGFNIANRPGLLDLLAAAREKRVDIVLANPWIVSRAVSRIRPGCTEESVPLGSALYPRGWADRDDAHWDEGHHRKDLSRGSSTKTRRGQIGRVKAGRIPGGRCFRSTVPRTANLGSGPSMRRKPLLSDGSVVSTCVVARH